MKNIERIESTIGSHLFLSFFSMFRSTISNASRDVLSNAKKSNREREREGETETEREREREQTRRVREVKGSYECLTAALKQAVK